MSLRLAPADQIDSRMSANECKSDLCIRQKRPVHTVKETCIYGKRGLCIRQKRPIQTSIPEVRVIRILAYLRAGLRLVGACRALLTVARDRRRLLCARCLLLRHCCHCCMLKGSRLAHTLVQTLCCGASRSHQCRTMCACVSADTAASRPAG